MIVIADGEAVALDENGSPDFAGLQAALSSEKTDDLIFFAFDLLFTDGEDLRSAPLNDRKERLKALLGERSERIRYVEHFTDGGEAVLRSACRMSLEGIVSKRLDAAYRPGRGGRASGWDKGPASRAGHEVVIGGWTTTGEAFRSLIAGVNRDGKLVHVGRIGTGFGRGKLATLLPRLKALETDRSPFNGEGAPRDGAGIHWVKPELVAEIEYAGFTGDGNIRQAAWARDCARLQAWKAAEVPRPRPRAGVEEVELARARAVATGAKPGAAIVMGVTLSHPDKPLWPAHGDQPAVTKLDLARYFEAVGPWMMRHLKGRPCLDRGRTPDVAGWPATSSMRHAMQGGSSWSLIEAR